MKRRDNDGQRYCGKDDGGKVVERNNKVDVLLFVTWVEVAFGEGD